MAQDNEQFATAVIMAWNSHDIDRAAAFYVQDYVGVDVSQTAPQQGVDGLRRAMTRYLQAFPDLHFTLEATIAQNDRLALVWTARGTHRDTLMGIPATGKTIEVRGVSVLTVETARIRHALHVWDVAGLLRNIGLLPDL